MQKNSVLAKKVISAAVTLGMIISMFACLSGLSVFAVDNSPAAQSPVTVAPVKTDAVTAPAKNNGDHIHCRCGLTHTNIGDHTASENRTYTAYSGTTMMPGSGSYYLTEDITVTSARTISGGTFVCLNGHTVTFSTVRLYLISSAIEADKMLVISDCQGTGKIVHDKVTSFGNTGALVLANATGNAVDIDIFAGTFDLRGSAAQLGGLYYIVANDENPAHRIRIYGGTFYGDNETADADINAVSGSLFYMRKAQSLNIYGGTLVGGTVKYRGGIAYLDGNSTANISGGTLIGGKITNQATDGAGGTCIFSATGATVNIGGNASLTGAEIAKNGSFITRGGAVYAQGALNISGNASIFAVNDTAFVTQGGAINCAGGLNISGNVRIHGGPANLGGAIMLAGGTNVIDLGDSGLIDADNANPYGISSNDGTYQGGCIYMGATGTLTIKGTGTITGSRNVRQGGAIYLSSANQTVNIQGCTINGGDLYYSTDGVTTAQCVGATIYSNAKLNISGGTINAGTITTRGTTASNIGMCIYQNTAKLSITGGTINGGNNSGSRNVRGGALVTNSADGVISGNAKIYCFDTSGDGIVRGGCIYAENSLTVNLGSEGVISNLGSSDGKVTLGGAIYLAKNKTLTVSGSGTISGKANEGGSIYGDEGSIINISGNPTVTGGSAVYNGGNIFGRTINISGGTVKDGTAGSNGGNIRITGSTTLTLSGTAVISGGKARNGGGISGTTGAVININGGTVKDGEAVMGGNIYTYGEGTTVNLNGGTVQNGVTTADNAANATRGGNICVDENSTLNIHDGATVTGGYVGVYHNADGNEAASFGGGNIYVGHNAVVNMDGGIVENGGTLTRGGGNFGGFYGSPVINITGGTVQNGYSPYIRTGNFYFAYRANGTLNISGGTVNKGTGTDDPENNIYYGGAWASFYNYYNSTTEQYEPCVNTVNIFGNPVINDQVGCTAGSFVEITEFTGNVTLGNTGDSVISAAWDSDYIDSGKAALLEGSTYYKSGGAVTILKQEHADLAADVASLDVIGDVHLADRDMLLEYDGYNAAAKAAFEAQHNYVNLDDMMIAAEDYVTMTETKISVHEGFGASGDRVLYVIYSSIDAANISDYDYAQIILTINGRTVGDSETDKIEDVYRNIYYNGVIIASADDYVYAAGHNDKSDYIYYTTLSLTNANSNRDDVEFDFFVRIYLVGGGFVDGAHKTGVLSDLLSL